MRESSWTQAVHKGVKPLYALKLNLPYTAGVADSWFSGARDIWIEFKYYSTLPKTINLTNGNSPKLSKLQQTWLQSRHAEGRNVAVIVACAEGAVWLHGLDWQTPISRDEFLKRVVPRKAIIQSIVAFCNNEGPVTCH